MEPGGDSLGSHLLDAGPALCLGGSSLLAEQYAKFFIHNSKVAQAVSDEIFRKADQFVSPGDPKRIQGVVDAAKRAKSALHSVFVRPVTITGEGQDLLDQVTARLVQLALAKGKTSGPTSHLGEAETIVVAKSTGWAMVTNDDDAHVVAGEAFCSHETFEHVVARMMVDHRVPGRMLFQELTKLRTRKIDTGGTATSHLDLRALVGPQPG